MSVSTYVDWALSRYSRGIPQILWEINIVCVHTEGNTSTAQEALRKRALYITNEAHEARRKRAPHRMVTHTHGGCQRQVPHTTDPSRFHFNSRLAFTITWDPQRCEYGGSATPFLLSSHILCMFLLASCPFSDSSESALRSDSLLAQSKEDREQYGSNGGSHPTDTTDAAEDRIDVPTVFDESPRGCQREVETGHVEVQLTNGKTKKENRRASPTARWIERKKRAHPTAGKTRTRNKDGTLTKSA